MPSSPRASTSIIVSGIVAIIGGAMGALSIIFVLLLFSMVGLGVTIPLPSAFRPFLYAIWIFSLLCAAFVVVVGVQVIRLRNWARISLLIISGCLSFFGAVGIVVIFFTIFITPYSDPRVSKAALASVLGGIYGVPIAVSIWWLILFTRRSVVTQFQAREQSSLADVASSVMSSSPGPSAVAHACSRFNNPDCPLGVRIVGWYLASFILIIPFLPLFASRVPALYFGHAFRGPAAIGIYFLNFVLVCIPGFGLLLLKRWSYPLAVVSQLAVCGNAVFSFAGNSFEATMRELMSSTELPGPQPGIETMIPIARYSMLLGLAIPIAILITLMLLRRKFYEAARRRASTPTNPAT